VSISLREPDVPLINVAILSTRNSVFDLSSKSETDEIKKNLWQRPWFRATLGLGVSVLFLYLAFQKVDFSVLKNAIVNISVFWILVSVAIGFVNLFLRALRWKFILSPIKRISVYRVISFLLIGFTINNILPLKVGELGRSVMLGNSERISKSSVLASVVVERWFDVIGLMVYLPVLLVALALPDQTKWFILASVTFSVLSIAAAYLIVIKRELSIRIITFFSSLLPKVIHEKIIQLSGSFFDGLSVLNSKRKISILLFTSVGMWLLTMFMTFIRFKAFSFELPFHAAIATQTGVNIAGAIPSSPSQIGVAHLAFQKILLLFGIDNSVALAFGIVSHALSFLSIVIPGSIFLLLHFLKSKK